MKICILDAKTLGDDIDLSVFNSIGETIIYDITPPEKVNERVKDVNVVITNKVILNKDNLSGADDLKLICVTATGTNNIDLNYTREKGIGVANVAGYSTNSVVQHTFATLFYILEKLSYLDNYVKTGEYIDSKVFTHLSKTFWEISGKRWGIIGLGEIGSGVAKAAEAFGCEVVYYSTSGKNNNDNYKRVELDELMKTSDIISVHAPLNEKTKDLVNYEKLTLMKEHAIILNMGRGGIINENDLCKVLDENKIGGAGLDVLTKEPMAKDCPFINVVNKDKFFVTPHIAWASIEARNRLIYEVLENINSYFKGEKRNIVN